MEAKSILEDFKRQRRLLRSLGKNTAKPRLKAMWNLLNISNEAKEIILKIPPVDHLISDALRTRRLEAGTHNEIIGIGFYIMKQCSDINESISDMVINLGISMSGKTLAEDYINDAMNGYINPALDFIEEELNKSMKSTKRIAAEDVARELGIEW